MVWGVGCGVLSDYTMLVNTADASLGHLAGGLPGDTCHGGTLCSCQEVAPGATAGYHCRKWHCA